MSGDRSALRLPPDFISDDPFATRSGRGCPRACYHVATGMKEQLLRPGWPGP